LIDLSDIPSRLCLIITPKRSIIGQRTEFLGRLAQPKIKPADDSGGGVIYCVAVWTGYFLG
jgi:hypothetical protein